MNEKHSLFGTFYKWQKDHKVILGILLVAFVLVFIFVPDTTTPGKYDRRVWITWANFMLSNGLENVYKLGVDYLPITHYILYGYTLLTGSTESIIANINSLKIFTFGMELVGVFYVYLLIKDKYPRQAPWACLIILLNPAYLYDSLLYGQWDGIYTTLVFISFYYALKYKLTLSLIFFLIAINAKIQALVYLPLVGFIWLEHLMETFEAKRVFKALVGLLVVQSLILLPFALTGDLWRVFEVGFNMVGRYPQVSMGANNMWFFIFENPLKQLDIHGVYGLSYNTYGLLAFFAMSFVVLFPLVIYLFFKIRSGDFSGRYPVSGLLIMGALLPVIFFYFNTQMHARYAHSAILFAGAFALYNRQYFFYTLASVAYFFNLEKASKILKGNIMEYQVFFMQPKFIASLFALLIIFGIYLLYRPFFSKTSRLQEGK